MSYHDRCLLNRRMVSRKSKLKVLDGAFSLTLYPRSPHIELGSLDDDWKAVGRDVRKAMKALENCG